MAKDDTGAWETAVLDGGPADGLRLRVAGRPGLLQVTYPCVVEDPRENVLVQALHLYRRTPRTAGSPLRYGFDAASP